MKPPSAIPGTKVSDRETIDRRARRPPPQRPDETPEERLNRNLDQLLQELRVALPGVQVLFAFLLVVPFNARFGELTARSATSTWWRCCAPRWRRRC